MPLDDPRGRNQKMSSMSGRRAPVLWLQIAERRMPFRTEGGLKGDFSQMKGRSDRHRGRQAPSSGGNPLRSWRRLQGSHGPSRDGYLLVTDFAGSSEPTSY